MDDLDLGSTIKGFVPGQKVFGRYTLKKVLGRGGMGVVWLAQDESLDREVALKFLPEVVAADARAVDDLKRETRRSLQLTHPHIVRIYDFIEDARTAAIAMEYVAGDTLAKKALAQPERVYSPGQLLAWVEQLCGALDYAHTRRQVVHRDLKPANLMIDEHGELKVADFGIAASVSDSVSRVSAQANSSGTPVYMSPQQMMGERPAVTDDVYALGATLYELLTSRPPFYTGNILMQVQNKVPPAIAARREELGLTAEAVPPEWEATIAACLAKEPKERPQSAGEVWARLTRPSAVPVMSSATDAASRSASVAMDRPRPMDRPRAAPRTARWVVAAAAVTALALAGWWFGIERPARRMAQERQEQVAFAGITARIDALTATASPETKAEIERDVRGFLQTGPGRFRADVESQWLRRLAAWEVARAGVPGARDALPATVQASSQKAGGRTSAEYEKLFQKDPDAEQARHREYAARLAEAKAHERRSEWQLARDAYDAALALEYTTEAKDGFARAANRLRATLTGEARPAQPDEERRAVEAREQEARLATMLAEADAALARNDWGLAIVRYEEALGLAPDRVDLKEALAKARDGERRDALNAAMARALAHEKNQEWELARASYNSALRLYPDHREASEGDARMGQAIRAVLQYENLIKSAEQRARNGEYREGIREFNEAMAIKPTALELTAQVVALREELMKQSQPVKITFRSDGETWISITNFRLLGKISAETINILPGNYEVIGRRQGFKDVVIPLQIRGGSPPSEITVICTAR